MFDEETFKKAQEGDPNSIEAICKATWEPLYRFIYFKVQNREEAEDITQETYVKALTYMRKNSIKPEKYVGFLKAVSLNVIRDRWRKSKRQGASVNIEAVNPAEVAIDDISEASAQRDIIENALKSLNAEQSEVLRLRILKGYSAAETARIMDKKEGTIRVIQYRALQALAAILELEG